MRRALRVTLLLTLLASGCTGVDGTLLVRHDRAGGAPGSAGTPGGGGAAPSLAGAGGAGASYVPAADSAWQAQLSGAIDPELSVELFYLDPDSNEPGALARLKEQEKHYVCYLSAGTFEPWRADANEFPERVRGNALENYPEEQWLDVRDATVRQLMSDRVAALALEGCEGIVPESMEVHAADTGFDLTLYDALDYAGWFVERIHAAGISAGLHGPSVLTTSLAMAADWGLAVACVEPSGCSEFQPLVELGKPVLHVEFGDEETAPDVCRSAERLGFDALIKRESFDAFRIACRDIL
jgi:hypothetical protein